MGNPETQFNQKQTDPSLADLLAQVKKDIMLSMNCHALATIQSFDAATQTVSATINYKKSYLQRGSDGVYSTVLKDYPILLDVPVIVIGGGGWNLTFPIKKDDTCLILFNDRAIDTWFQSGQINALPSNRLHSISDGIALVGVRSMANLISGYDETRAVLSNGQTMVGVSEDKIKIANATTSLGLALDQLLIALQTMTTAMGAATTAPQIAAAAAATVTPITNVKTLLEGLLE